MIKITEEIEKWNTGATDPIPGAPAFQYLINKIDKQFPKRGKI